jgi:hypothetical protein
MRFTTVLPRPAIIPVPPFRGAVPHEVRIARLGGHSSNVPPPQFSSIGVLIPFRAIYHDFNESNILQDTTMIPRAVMVGVGKDMLDLIISERLAEVVSIFSLFAEPPVMGVPWIGPDAGWPRFSAEHPDVRVIVTTDARRRSLAESYGLERGMTIIAKGASISSRATVDVGCIVQRGVMVSADVCDWRERKDQCEGRRSTTIARLAHFPRLRPARAC